MITNERQLSTSKVQAERFRSALAAMEQGSLDATDLHPMIKRAQIDAVRGQLAELEAEIADYEALRSGTTTVFELGSLAELPRGLIRARIAARLTQRELAERLGLKEQQIQRYEATRFEGASFGRLVEVADAIGVEVRERLELLGATSPDAVLKRLATAGLDEVFVRRRLASDLAMDRAGVEELTKRVGAVFGWSRGEFIGSGPLDPARLGGAVARFKMPKGRNGRAAALYTAYAYRLAMACARAMQEAPRERVPPDWRAFRAAAVDRYGGLDFRAVVRFAWDLGVVVLPLDDRGAFHGAIWRLEGVNVVVLKQAARYSARWLFDLLHELRHAAEDPDAPEFEVVEEPETSAERRSSPSERQASWFAGQVALDGRAEELVKESLERAGGDLRRLKMAVEATARLRDVRRDVLANYMAFRLSLQGENWWGVATNLQDTGDDPLTVAREAFFERFAFDRVDPLDAKLLALALNDGDGDA